MNRDLDALRALTATLVRRLLREGLVMRSLVWPSGLAGGALLGTLVFVSLIQVSSVVAVPPALDPDLRAELTGAGFALAEAADPSAAVYRGDAWAGTDGAQLWVRGGSRDADRLEALLRARRGSSWTPNPAAKLPEADRTRSTGADMVRMLLLLFALYGVVFGLGMVARDRDDGTLEAELSLPIARWVPGAARWLAGTVVLTAFLAYAVALFDALIGVEDPGSLIRHGFAAAGGTVALGIGLIGTAGVRRGFSGPLAFGLTIATGLLGVGLAEPDIGRFLPICSVLAGGDGWVSALLAAASGVGSAALFAWRSARA